MSNPSSKPIGLEIDLLETQGGKVPLEYFHKLISQLQKNHSLDHLSASPASAGEFDVVYIILSKGTLYEETETNAYECIIIDGWSCWPAGFAYLLVPPNRRREKANISGGDNGPSDTADIKIALLPIAQTRGFGRFVIRTLLSHAFDALGIRRVTASILCPIQPSHSVAQKKQVGFNTKQLCWIFEKFGFKFEGISRGALMSMSVVEGEEPVWHDVHRMSMLITDYFQEKRSLSLSAMRSFSREFPLKVVQQSPWEIMIQRQEKEKHDVESWSKRPNDASANDACGNDGEASDDETVLGGDEISEK
ncbi:unnamed protein product [Rhizoctonia solani]|uniref:N-acetyltransferase domain-containing protein n=1 Tax=Rhizoctonia solani TaxID=456999 RepID=A0A8H3A3T6_9AGAM|nr:unnamed protein product [Rhizoctonia solani]